MTYLRLFNQNGDDLPEEVAISPIGLARRA